MIFTYTILCMSSMGEVNYNSNNSFPILKHTLISSYHGSGSIWGSYKVKSKSKGYKNSIINEKINYNSTTPHTHFDGDNIIYCISCVFTIRRWNSVEVSFLWDCNDTMYICSPPLQHWTSCHGWLPHIFFHVNQSYTQRYHMLISLVM